MNDARRVLLSFEKVNQLFDAFNDLKIMIIGDVMLDAYVFGKVDRISPEAPVPVVAVKNRSNRMGGAANVALNIHALGAEPILVTVVGNDKRGEELLQLFEENKMPQNGIYVSNERLTTTKFRIIGNNMQMLRVDEENTHDLTANEESTLLKKVQQIIENQKVDAIIFQDYNKGVLTKSLIEQVIAMAKRKNIPTAVDPKKRNFLSFRGVSLFKPNLKELKDGLNLGFNPSKISEIIDAVAILQDKIDAQIVLATLSENGILVRERLKEQQFNNTHLPAHLRNIADVSGAGDTVISVATLCLALEQKPEIIAVLSNLAGGLVCEEVGVVPVNKNKLHEEILKLRLETT